MKFHIRVDGRQRSLDVQREGELCRYMLEGEGLNGSVRSAAVLEVEPFIYSILLDGASYEATVEPGDGCLYVSLRGHRLIVEVQDPRKFLPRGRGGPAEGLQQIAALMPGKVVRVLVEKGDQVEAGQGLLVVEAMKMQNEMKAPKAGRVTTLKVREGDTVGAGDVLAIIE